MLLLGPFGGLVADRANKRSLLFLTQSAGGLLALVLGVLVVSGTGDSAYAGSGYVNQVAAETLNKIALSGVRALAVGPTWYETPVPSEVSGVSDEIRQAAAAAGVPFLDALDPPWLTPQQMQPDFTGPTDEGQSVIADKIAAWLRTEVAR